MQSIASLGRVHHLHGVALRDATATDLVGPIVSDRRPVLEIAASPDFAPGQALAGTTRGLDVCRLLVAVLGISVYLAIPAGLIALGVALLSS